MIDVIYMILRRLRVPLIILIAVYAISIFGLAIAPGVDPDGNPWRMGFFHATYVMSYTATTIGFGELPFPFSDQQRAWLIISIYLSVLAWTYAVGSVFAMTTDRTFRRTVARNVFRWQVKRLSGPFFVICGAGRSALALTQALDQLGHRVVVVEIDGERATRFALNEFLSPPLIMEADASHPGSLKDAGIHRRWCQGVIALTSNEHANQTIAIGAKLLREDITVIARVTDAEGTNNLHAFGNVHAVNPFQVLATNLSLDIAAPEGASVLVVEELEHAIARGAHIYAELVGTGLSADAYHLTATHPDGLGAKLVMTNALEDAGLSPEDIDYINVHGTSTPVGDISESKAIKEVFGDAAYKLNISSTKSMTGHLLGAAGAIEAVFALKAVEEDIVPPTINHAADDEDPEIDYKLNFTFNQAQRRTVRAALSNTFGFGGHNASVIFKKYEK